jgi:DNA repair photolyase
MTDKIPNQKTWLPAITSTFTVYPIPFRLDTYHGCMFNCRYCFARDFVMFARRKSDKIFTDLEYNNPTAIAKWIERIEAKEIDYTKAEEVAFKERIPIKIGVTSDPFPPVEEQLHITYDILKILDKYDYPVQMSTKNPAILAKYYKDFKNPNWIIAVTIISDDVDFVKVIEPGAPSVDERFKAIKELTDQGANVIVRIQPVIYPKILAETKSLIDSIADAGCVGFIMEGLKIRIAMNKKEQIIYQEISDYLGYDIREWYRKSAAKDGADYILNTTQKETYIALATKYAHERGIKIYCGDNDMYEYGDSRECCGTEFLRNYKIMPCNLRAEDIEIPTDKCANEFCKCGVNFIRSNKYDGMTVTDACKSYIKSLNKTVKNDFLNNATRKFINELRWWQFILSEKI